MQNIACCCCVVVAAVLCIYLWPGLYITSTGFVVMLLLQKQKHANANKIVFLSSTNRRSVFCILRFALCLRSWACVCCALTPHRFKLIASNKRLTDKTTGEFYVGGKNNAIYTLHKPNSVCMSLGRLSKCYCFAVATEHLIRVLNNIVLHMYPLSSE